MSEDTPPFVISIKPDPTPEEMAVVTAAIAAATRLLAPMAELEPEQHSRWSRQGRVEAMRGLDRDDSLS